MGYNKREVTPCSGFSNTWPKKGWPCGAPAKHYKDGKWWCKNHLPVDEHVSTSTNTYCFDPNCGNGWVMDPNDPTDPGVECTACKKHAPQ